MISEPVLYDVRNSNADFVRVINGEMMTNIETILDSAELIYSMTDINAALDKLSEALTAQFANDNPIILTVMNGASVITGHLLPRLAFPLQLDYIHLSRYGDEITGSNIIWLREPSHALQERTVIIVEDIVDHGITVQAVREYCHDQGVKSVVCATLLDKLDIDKKGQPPEYVGMTVPNRYVFGFGLDYKGYWRNLPAIYALAEHHHLQEK